VDALNLKRSPGNFVYWERADPFMGGAGDAGGAKKKDECRLSPRGLRQQRDAQRRASNQASDEQGLLGEVSVRV
jgi:hypothetical protein